MRIGSLNVQGFADTLKLKSALQVMAGHRIDVLLLSETKSTSYYSYVSEGHLVILSGNTRDKHAGVGAIISPHLRPYLMDVIQVNNRIVHLCFGRQKKLHSLVVAKERSNSEWSNFLDEM